MQKNEQEKLCAPGVYIAPTRGGSVCLKKRRESASHLLKLTLSFLVQLALLLAIFIPCVQGVLALHKPLTSKPMRHISVHPYGYALRVAVPSSRTASGLSPYGPGFEQELLKEFCGVYGYNPAITSVASRDEALDLLREGKVNLVAGFGGEVPGRFEKHVVEGPAYAHFRPIMVERAGTAQDVLEKFFSVAVDLSPQILGSDSSKLLLDPAAYSLWLPLNTNMRTGSMLDRTVSYHWFWGREDLVLDADLEEFWTKEETASQLGEMTERYYGFLPSKPQPADLKALSDAMNSSLVEYRDVLQRASQETGLDPLLIAAVIFQESRFDPDAVSSTGVRGIMQLTQNTADMLKVNRLNPEECIMGGARYLHSLWKDLEGMGLEPWDRWCMALAAFNQGPGNLRRVLRHADADPPTWAELKRLYPEVSRRGLAGSSFRGREAVDFVESVRYYYYVFSALSGVVQSEGENFASLRAALTRR